MTGPSNQPPAPPRIGLYGGSFNPPHLAHVMVVAWALARGEVDEVWVIPTGGHPFGKPLAPWEARVAMCWQAFACFGERISLLDIEREPRVHYSIETVRTLAARVPDVTWRWVMGSDTLADAEKWREWDALLRLAPPLIIPRAGRGGAAGPFELPDISSTQVRQAIARGDSATVAHLLPGGVAAIIRERQLYTQP